VVVATEAERVGGARRGQDLEAVRAQVVTEQVEGGRVVLGSRPRVEAHRPDGEVITAATERVEG
jgi:hypothetical protein